MIHGAVPESPPVAGYRLVEKTECIKPGDVAGSVMKKLVGQEWYGTLASQFNQSVFRPMKSFVDLN
jgi:hypothetical protein